jgi:drug/metabolite transporter (DMT)-like permease
MKRDASHNLAGAAWMIASMAGFAVEDAFLKSAATHLPLGQVLTMMGIMGVLCFGGLAIGRGEKPIPQGLFSGTMIIRTGFEIVGRLFYGLAVALTPISTASAILQATPLVVVLGAAFLFGEKVGALRWLLITLGFVGVLIIIKPGYGSSGIAGSDETGFTALSLLAVVGVIGFAGRDLATRAAAPSLSMAQLGVAGFLALIFAGMILLVWQGGAALPSAMAWAQVAGTTVFGVLGYGALTQAMRTGQVSAVTPFRYSRLLFAMILGVVVFGERPDGTTMLGATLIVGCGVILMASGRRARKIAA